MPSWSIPRPLKVKVYPWSYVFLALTHRCDDNSNNVSVIRATLYCWPFSNGCQPFRFIVDPTVGPTMNLAGWQPLLSGRQYSVSALLNHVIVIWIGLSQQGLPKPHQMPSLPPGGTNRETRHVPVICPVRYLPLPSTPWPLPGSAQLPGSRWPVKLLFVKVTSQWRRAPRTASQGSLDSLSTESAPVPHLEPPPQWTTPPALTISGCYRAVSPTGWQWWGGRWLKINLTKLIR